MNLDELQRLAEGATQGPWRIKGRTHSSGEFIRIESLHPPKHLYQVADVIAANDYPENEANAAYIAAMSPDTAKKLIAVARAGLALLPVLDEYLAHRGPEEESLRIALEELK